MTDTIPTPETNKEHIKRIYEQLNYLTGAIADIKIMLEHLKERREGMQE